MLAPLAPPGQQQLRVHQGPREQAEHRVQLVRRAPLAQVVRLAPLPQLGRQELRVLLARAERRAQQVLRDPQGQRQRRAPRVRAVQRVPVAQRELQALPGQLLPMVFVPRSKLARPRHFVPSRGS